MGHNEHSIDTLVLKALKNKKIWKISGGITGAGYFIIHRSELEKQLSLSRRDIISSLDRLESAGEITNDGSSIDRPDDPAYYVS